MFDTFWICINVGMKDFKDSTKDLSLESSVLVTVLFSSWLMNTWNRNIWTDTIYLLKLNSEPALIFPWLHSPNSSLLPSLTLTRLFVQGYRINTLVTLAFSMWSKKHGGKSLALFSFFSLFLLFSTSYFLVQFETFLRV